MSKLQFNIRPANESDAFSIATIGYNCWQECYKNLIPADFLASISIERQIERAETTIRQGGGILMATDAEHKAVGYCGYGRSRDSGFPLENEIYSLYIARHVRSKSLGAILLLEASRRFAINRPIMVHTLRDNIGARRFYESNGFIYQPDRDGSFRNIAPEVTYLRRQ